MRRLARATRRPRADGRLKPHRRRADTVFRGARRKVEAMLVLTRKLGEVIRVGDAVTVRVLEVKGNQVRLGVEAPAEVRIYREEVYRAIHKESEDAARHEGGVALESVAWPKQREKA